MKNVSFERVSTALNTNVDKKHRNGSISPSNGNKVQKKDSGLNQDAIILINKENGFSYKAFPISIDLRSIVFECFNRGLKPKPTESIENFKLIFNDILVYEGEAIICNVIDCGSKFICEGVLQRAAWIDESVDALTNFSRNSIENGTFLEKIRKPYCIENEYRLAVCKIEDFLRSLKNLCDLVSCRISSGPKNNYPRSENEAALEMRDFSTLSLKTIFEEFELAARKIPLDLKEVHALYAQRVLHPWLLCSPLINRTYVKPLGYAGDYEMMNMLVRNGLEGANLYAKLVNSFLLDQPPAHAVRNRVNFLNKSIINESYRVAASGKHANIYCIACGPAWEVSNFIQENPLARNVRFTLLDFNQETLDHTSTKIRNIYKDKKIKCEPVFVKNSVQNIIKAGALGKLANNKYDLIYCSGLYDYLTDSVCKALNTCLFEMLNPGGLLVVGNFAKTTPITNFMEHLLEWNLIYRDKDEVLALKPETASTSECVVKSEPSGTNFFLEVRKHG